MHVWLVVIGTSTQEGQFTPTIFFCVRGGGWNRLCTQCTMYKILHTLHNYILFVIVVYSETIQLRHCNLTGVNITLAPSPIPSQITHKLPTRYEFTRCGCSFASKWITYTCILHYNTFSNERQYYCKYELLLRRPSHWCGHYKLLSNQLWVHTL